MNELISRAPLTIEQVIAVWIDEKAGHTGSENTRRSYAAVISKFRAACQRVGLDLDSPPEQVALVAQGWLGGMDVKAATYSQRRAVISSFYTFVRRRRLLTLDENPAEMIDARKVQLYRNPRFFSPEEVAFLFDLIDRATLEGKRDYALLSMYITTGRRLSEIVSLRWGKSVLVQDKNLVITVEDTKGGKTVINRLGTPVAAAVLDWLTAWYGPTIPIGAPLWVSLSNNSRGQPLGDRGVGIITQKRLGTTKVHALRHTFAHAMVDAGAPMNVIQKQLGHGNLGLTGIYVAALSRGENPFTDALVRMFGLEG